ASAPSTTTRATAPAAASAPGCASGGAANATTCPPMSRASTAAAPSNSRVRLRRSGSTAATTHYPLPPAAATTSARRPPPAVDGVDRVAAGEHEIERTFTFEHSRERSRRGQRVGSGEGFVRDEHAAVGAPRDRLAQDVLRGRWPERDDRARPAGRGRQLDA